MRDDFTEETKRVLSQRVGGRCSNPNCVAQTSGPRLYPSKAINIGVAAHITAASEDGPRYEPSLTPEQRRDPNNGIWLCQNCAKLVDNDPIAFPAEKLRNWKRQSEANAFSAIGRTIHAPSAVQLSAEELDILLAAADQGNILLMDYDQGSAFFQAGTKKFVNPADPEYAAIYMEALHSLQKKELVRFVKGNLYNLTRSGFQIARELQTRIEC